MGMKFKSLAGHLEALPDPRQVRGRRHVLLDILVIAVLAVLCGIDDFEGTEEFAKEQEGCFAPSWPCPTASLPTTHSPGFFACLHGIAG